MCDVHFDCQNDGLVKRWQCLDAFAVICEELNLQPCLLANCKFFATRT